MPTAEIAGKKPDRYQIFVENEDEIVKNLQDDYSDVRQSLRAEMMSKSFE